MSSTTRLARYVAQTPRTWPAALRERAARAFVDTVGCMVAGAGEASTRLAYQTVAPWGEGPASVVGRGRGLAAPWAALVNGVAAHALDYDDVLEPALSHVSAVLVPAILADGEAHGADGGAALDAYIVGFEVMTLLALAMNQGHYALGWHTTVTMGAPAAAAACARLRRLDEAQSRAALAMATSLAAGSRAHMGTMTKHLHAGFAAKAGIMAAGFAAAGMTAAEEAYEGPWGFETLFGAPDARPLATVLHTLDSPPALERHGIWVKPYPCCASAHRPIDAARALRDGGIAVDEIAAVRVTLPSIAHNNLMYPEPTNDAEARFSLQHCVAVALRHGQAGLDAFTEDAITDPDTKALRAKITATPDAGQPAAGTAGATTDRAAVEIRLEDGRTVRESVSIPRGHPDRPLTDDELRAKFHTCAEPALGAGATRDLLDACFGFGELAVLTALGRPLRDGAATTKQGSHHGH